MTDGNGGSLSTADRLNRIEKTLDIIQREMREALQTLSSRISRHKEANQEQVRKLVDSLVNSYESRISALETHDAKEEAVSSYRRWLVGLAVVVLMGVIGNSIALLTLLGKVN